MAELIDKQMVINTVAKTTTGGYFSRAIEKVDQLPTTTEAEIRNRAIDEFAEKLSMHFADWQLAETDYDIRYTIDSAISAVDEIADQLKEE